MRGPPTQSLQATFAMPFLLHQPRTKMLRHFLSILESNDHTPLHVRCTWPDHLSQHADQSPDYARRLGGEKLSASAVQLAACRGHANSPKGPTNPGRRSQHLHTVVLTGKVAAHVPGFQWAVQDGKRHRQMAGLRNDRIFAHSVGINRWSGRGLPAG